MFYRVITVILCFLLFACQTANEYVPNRLVDFTDSFTLGVEKNNYGIGVWVWCLGGGLHFNQSAKGAGIRNGQYGLYRAGGEDEIAILNAKGSRAITNQTGNSFLVFNSNQHRVYYPDLKRSRKKSYDATNIAMLVFFTDKKHGSGVKYCHSPVNIEFSIGLYLGIRAGFNFSEFADFLLGFSTYDFMEDDYLR